MQTRYFFFSEGKRIIAKLVEYDYAGINEGRDTYNLGFGTYNQTTNNRQDYELSSNDDAYLVFNTVLSTIPHFLQSYPEAMVMVKGSDSEEIYPEICRLTCKKKCIEPDCKNAHRRINIYKNFLNKNLEQLTKEYTFWGPVKGDENQKVTLEGYRIVNDYNSIFFAKK
jgi:hypothetical protein